MSLEYASRSAPDVSILAHDVYESLDPVILGENPNDLNEKAERTRETLRLVGQGDKLLGRWAREAAGLIPIAEKLSRDNPPYVRAHAAVVLAERLTRPGTPISNEDITYMMSLWGDLPHIKAASLNYKERLTETEDGTNLLITLDEKGGAQLTPNDWLDTTIGVNIPELSRLSEVVNVESILIDAAYKLDDLVNADMGSSEQFMHILEAETVHAPMLDAFGMYVFETMQRNEINKLRMINAGRSDLVEIATREVDRVREIGLEPILQLLFDNVPEEKIFHISDQTPYGETFHFIDADLSEMTSGRWKGRVVCRIKSPGPLARKLEDPRYKAKGAMPMDIVGITVILDSNTPEGDEDTQRNMAQIVRFLEEEIMRKIDADIRQERFRLTAAASKEEAICVQGPEEYIVAFGKYASPSLYERTEREVRNFRAVKGTLMMMVHDREVPTEIQIQAAGDRKWARTDGAHLLMDKNAKNAKGFPATERGDKSDLERILRRKTALVEGDRNDLRPVGTSAYEFEALLIESLALADELGLSVPDNRIL